ncbi:MAG TPA: rhomboid family intramembrane serine protease [Terriglobales bacterium]|nr:rhomboid family intramembrane serine protease [Terriglobales bacterium]
MLIPIKHEDMSARRWPIITIALIVINVVVFLATFSEMGQEGPELGKVKLHILLLAAEHPELTLPPDSQQFVSAVRDHHPGDWTKLQSPTRKPIDSWDARVRSENDPGALQQEMDSLVKEYSRLTTSAIVEQYAFVPAHPKAIAYLTANFLHGGWLHLIGNMWFLWLAGFVLEDVWGRPLFTIFYLLSGAAALQFHAWMNAGSVIPTLGASGAVAALMGAFLVRFPKMKIEMVWFVFLRPRRFKAPAYYLLPLWLFMELFYGSLLGSSSGVAHWAHVGGFAFGALAALGLRYSGLENKMNQAIEEKVGWSLDPEINHANALIEQGQHEQAISALQNYLAAQSDSIDALTLLRQVYAQRSDTAAYQSVTIQLCAAHLKAGADDAAWQDYEEFLSSGGQTLPAGVWLDLCRVLERQQQFDRALSEYQKVITAYASERHSLVAQIAAARLCLKRLNRPEDALRFYQAAGASKVPHLDWEQAIEIGIREANRELQPAH